MASTGFEAFIAAYEARTGKEMWRFYTIPGPGEPGHETWEACPPNPKSYCDPEAWKHGGASVWVTGSFDPQLNLTYWGTGNAGPDYNHEQRPGDNLYTASVVALDADTGKLRWHYQFTPHDRYDYDSVQVPVLADITWQGAPLKAMLWANRNGNFYVLDRATGKFLLGKPFVKLNWMSGFDANGQTDSDTAAAGHADLSCRAGWIELVLAVLQSANEIDVRIDVGRERPDVRGHSNRLRVWPRIRRRRQSAVRADAGRAHARHPRRPEYSKPAPRTDQQLDRRGRQRLRAGHRSDDRRGEVEVPDDRCDRHRHLHNGNRSPDSPVAAKDTCRRSTRAPGRSCGRRTSARRC